MAQMPAVSNSSTVRRTFSPLPQPWSASTSSARLPARQIRLAWPANSVKVSTTRSGAPSTDIDPIEPENIPTSKPRSSAMRAEIASYTDPGCTQRFPERIARNRPRRSVQLIVSHPLLFGGILPITPLLVFNRLHLELGTQVIAERVDADDHPA